MEEGRNENNEASDDLHTGSMVTYAGVRNSQITLLHLFGEVLVHAHTYHVMLGQRRIRGTTEL